MACSRLHEVRYHEQVIPWKSETPICQIISNIIMQERENPDQRSNTLLDLERIGYLGIFSWCMHYGESLGKIQMWTIGLVSVQSGFNRKIGNLGKN